LRILGCVTNLQVASSKFKKNCQEKTNIFSQMVYLGGKIIVGVEKVQSTGIMLPSDDSSVDYSSSWVAPLYTNKRWISPTIYMNK
jgi:hypothetical protein